MALSGTQLVGWRIAPQGSWLTRRGFADPETSSKPGSRFPSDGSVASRTTITGMAPARRYNKLRPTVACLSATLEQGADVHDLDIGA